MKNLILTLMSAFFIVGCAGQAEAKKDAVLEFEVRNPASGEVVVVCQGDMEVLPLDGDGHASVVMEGVDAAYAKVFHGTDSRLIYFEKGDAATISFDGGDFSRTFTFDGAKASVVNYLDKVKLTALPDRDYALPFDEYLERIRMKENEALQLLKANGLSSAGRFERMEEGRIRYSYAAPLLMYPVGHMMMTGDRGYVPDEEYYRVLETYFVEDEEWAALDVYRAFMAEAAHVLDEANRDETSVYPKTLAQMRFAAGRLGNAKVRSAVLHHTACAYVDNFGIDDIQDMENIYNTYVKDELMLASFREKCDRWDLSRPGRMSPEISAVDIDGRKWRLEDFREKYIYVDLWATWCAPCRREIPYLKDIEEKFRDAQIVFLGLSVDSDKAKWEDAVRSGELAGVQLYLGSGSSFQKAYKVEGIPRFILIGRDGRIVDNDMSRPSSPETIPALEALEGIR